MCYLINNEFKCETHQRTFRQLFIQLDMMRLFQLPNTLMTIYPKRQFNIEKICTALISGIVY